MQRFHTALLYLLSLTLSAHSFVLIPLLATKKVGLFNSFFLPEESFSDQENDDHSFNIEEARKQLEALVGGGEPSAAAPQQSSVASSPVIDRKQKPFAPWTMRSQTTTPRRDGAPVEIILPEAPPLTTMDRERRLTEVELLKHLAEGDRAIAALWEFWFQERGRHAAAQLYKAETLSAQRDTWNEAEDLLLELIETHGVHWAEPVNRLATLYFIQGRLEEAEKLCLTVLKVKPWHFGALSGIVLIYAAMNAPEEARHWAALRLPGISAQGASRRRIEWVNRSIDQAMQAFHDSEERLSESFGPIDNHSACFNSNQAQDPMEDHGSWQ